MPPFTVYLILEFTASLLFSLVFTVSMVYQVTVVHLTPLQLVLVGTLLEGSVFAFEIPTGILADMKSRRLSIIIGYVLIGVGFVVEGSLPFFATVAMAQVIWGLGYTFTSGATQAWIADELGQERAGEAFMQGSQAARVGSLIAIPISVALGSIAVHIPIVVGGLMMILLAVFLAIAMSERGFAPKPTDERRNWTFMLRTAADARQMVRRQPLLLVLLGISLFYGLYSEGFDRLWTAHFLENLTLPFADSVQPVIWFGVIRGMLLVLSLLATEVVRRRIDANRADQLARWLLWAAGLIVAALVGFGLTHSFGVALGLFLLIGALRSISQPLQTVWYNSLIDEPRVRATLFSVMSQVDAIGQIAGGPVVGAIGNFSIRAALVTSAVLLTPVLALYTAALRRTRNPTPG